MNAQERRKQNSGRQYLIRSMNGSVNASQSKERKTAGADPNAIRNGSRISVTPLGARSGHFNLQNMTNANMKTTTHAFKQGVSADGMNQTQSSAEQIRENLIHQPGTPYLAGMKHSCSAVSLGVGKFSVHKAGSVKKVIIKPRIARIFNSTTPKRSRAQVTSLTD